MGHILEIIILSSRLEPTLVAKPILIEDYLLFKASFAEANKPQSLFPVQGPLRVLAGEVEETLEFGFQNPVRVAKIPTKLSDGKPFSSSRQGLLCKKT